MGVRKKAEPTPKAAKPKAAVAEVNVKTEKIQCLSSFFKPVPASVTSALASGQGAAQASSSKDAPPQAFAAAPVVAETSAATQVAPQASAATQVAPQASAAAPVVAQTSAATQVAPQASVPAPSVDASGDSRKRTAAEIYKLDKNRVDHKIRKGSLPQHDMDTWKAISAKGVVGTTEKKQQFVREVAACTDGAYDSEYFSKTEYMENVKTSRAKDKWRSWERYKTDHGYACAMAIVQGRPELTRMNRELPEGHTVPWPDHLEIFNTDNTELRDVKHGTRVELKSKIQDDSGQAAAAFKATVAVLDTPSDSTSTPVAAAAPASSTPSGTRSGTGTKIATEEMDKRHACIQKIRTARRTWDSASMDYKITHQNAAGNIYVSAALMELFSKLIDDGATVDKKMQKADEQYRQTGDVRITEMQESIKLIEEIKKTAKLTQGKIINLTDGQ